MSEPIKVSFTITVEDLVVYLRLLQRRLNTIGVLLGIAVMGFGAIIATITSDPFTGVWTLGIGALLVFFAGTEFLDRWRVRRAGRSLIDSEASFVFDDEGISADTVTGTGKVAWAAVTQLLSNDRVLVVKRDRVPVVWIPTRAFSTPEEVVTLVEFIEGHIGRGESETA